MYVKRNGPMAMLRGNSALKRQFDARGGVAGSLGWPYADESCVAGRGCVVRFAASSLVWGKASGFIGEVQGSIRDKWSSLRGLSGVLGAPVSDMSYSSANGGGWLQDFEGGSVYVKRNGPTKVTYR